MANKTSSLVDLVFSWSLHDVLNEHLYRNQVHRIPDTFDTVSSYKNSFLPSLIEETHADLLSTVSASSTLPTCQILGIVESADDDDLLYNLTYTRGNETDGDENDLVYEPQVGDIVGFTTVRPKCIDDLNRPPMFYHIAYVVKASDVDEFCDILWFKVRSSKPIDCSELNKSNKETFFAVHLINLLTNIRVWKALISEEGNTNTINKVLQPNSDDGDYCCPVCFSEEKCRSRISAIWPTICSHNLNDSQTAALLNCINLSQCRHHNSVKLIWGPPGTGKTKTMSLTLFALLELKCRTLTCAPTNIAVLEVAARLRRVVNQSLEYGGYGLGDIVLFGNKKRMKIENHGVVHDIFLDNRVKILIKCLVPLSGWKHLLSSMIRLFDDPMEHYSMYLQKRAAEKTRNAEKYLEDDLDADYPLTFEEFLKNEFESVSVDLMSCMVDLYTHLPTSCISLEVVKGMVQATDFLKSIKSSLDTVCAANKGLKLIDFKIPRSTVRHLLQLITRCTSTLKSLPNEFAVPIYEYALKHFCLENACSILCTASTSSNLHVVAETSPFDLLVIDEAAQLKECESAIPLQICGLRHAILVGDERQLPAMVKSKIATQANFGRSLFARLAKLGHKKHLLDIQYRMHPSISLFPKVEFYHNQITDGPNVKETSYERCFLKGKMYQSYSFINVASGKEEFDYRYSRKNMVEVAVVSKIVASLYEEFRRTKEKVSIGIISPYKAQVCALLKRLKKFTDTSDTGFSVTVRSVDGFQGGEEDVIIISTVRCNGNGSVGFLSNRQRANVALTRARFCLWIVGSASTLITSGSVWKKLVLDAKKRNCFHNADEESNLAQAITTTLVELEQLHSLLNTDSKLFQNSIWKVFFTCDFKNSISKIKDTALLGEVLLLLTRISHGWRCPRKDKENDIVHDGISVELLEKYEINRHMNLIWTVNIIQENAHYVQVIMFWDILPPSHIPGLAKQLDIVFGNFTVDKMNRCKQKCMDRDTIVPLKWPVFFSNILIDDHEEFISKSLSSLKVIANLKTLTSTYGETEKTVNPVIYSKNNVNPKERFSWKIKAKDGVNDFNTCIETDPLEFLSKPLSSPSVADKAKESTSTDIGKIADRYISKSSSKGSVNKRSVSSWKQKVVGCSSGKTNFSEHHETLPSQPQADGVKGKQVNEVHQLQSRSTDDADHRSVVLAWRRVNSQKELIGAGIEDDGASFTKPTVDSGGARNVQNRGQNLIDQTCITTPRRRAKDLNVFRI